MRNSLKQPFSNLVAIFCTLAVILALVFSGAGLGELAPLALGGAGTTNLDSLSVAGDLAVTGDTAITGNTTAEGFALYGAAAPITVAHGGTITPLGTFQPLTAAGDVGASLVTTTVTAGTIVVLHNTANQTITITDTTTAKLSGNIALGQFDSAVIIFDGTNWVQVAESDN